MKSANIIMLPLSALKAHPQNPRKDLGDLSELSESIKTKGIMQNLTVTDNHDGTYTVIIGHRRMAAAKAAGLEEAPCAVVEMDEGDQLATMLLENMQRTDLTVYEQAEGIQLLLDMSFSVSDIAEKTGFSESTVRRRTKLLTFDRTKFKAAQARQVSFAEYERLYEVEDGKERDRLLDVIGTKDFDNELSKALSHQNVLKEIREAEKQLEEKKNVEFVQDESEDWKDGCVYETTIFFNSWGKIREPVLDPKKKYRAKIDLKAERIIIYRKMGRREKTANSRKNEEEIKREAYFREAKEINRRIRALRTAFVESPPKLNALKYNILVKEFVRIIFEDNPLYGAATLSGDFDSIYDKDGGAAIMLSIAQRALDSGEFNGYVSTWDYYGRRRENTDLNRFYYLITRLGYEMSTEEIQLRDGTHEIFIKGKEE